MPPRRKFKSYCESCGNELKMNKGGSYPKKFCSIRCFYDFNSGGNNYKFKGRIDGKYVRVRVNKKIIFEHRYLMEKALGRKLKKDEHIHHLDGDSRNNNLNNLILVSPTEHRKLHIGEPHYSMRKYKFVSELPIPRDEGSKICLMPQRRSYETIKCCCCGRLFWSRADYKKENKTCGVSCWFELDRRKNGRAKNIRYNYVCSS